MPATGATAAYALDSAIADVALRDGVATIFAVSPGATQIVIVTPAGLQYLAVVVRSARQLPFFRSPRQLQDANGSFETQYDSFARRWQNIIGYRTQNNDRITSLYLNDTILRDRAAPVRHVIPAASFRIWTPARELVLFDDNVRTSPLTLDGAIVRGLHLRDGGLQLHAGYSSFSFFDNLLFSRTRSAVAGLSDVLAIDGHSAIKPALYVFPTRHSGRGTAGTVASLEYVYDGGPGLRLRSEAAVSRSFEGKSVLPGGYFELLRSAGADTQSIRGEYQPDGFASLDTAVHGLRSDGLWIHDVPGRWRSTASFSANRISLAGFRQTNVLAEEILRFAVRPKWFVESGVRDSYLDSPDLPSAIQTVEIPVGIEYDTPHFAAGSTYSYLRSNGTDRGGNGVHVFLRAQTDTFTGNIYALRRTQTPTLEFVFDAIPGLELALQQFGLTASTPQDLVRLLRDFPDLANSGLIRGIDLNISPVHYQAGTSLSWRGRSEREPRVDMVVNYIRDELVSRTQDSGIASATYAFRITPSIEVAAQFSRYFSRQDDGRWRGLSGWNLALRHRFNDLPAPGSIFAKRGDVSGIVFADPEARGEYFRDAAGIGGVEVLLDGTIRTTTAANGRFVFSGVRTGTHRVEARYASAKPFRYTTPAVIETDVDAPVAIGVGSIAGHLTANIRSTDGTPVDRVQVIVQDGQRLMMADSSGGKSSIDLPRAETLHVSVNSDSLPPGYLVVDGGPKTVRIEEGKPASVDFILRPLRSISGRVTTINGEQKPLRGVRVMLDDNTATATTDEEGNFVFREVSAGPHTVRAARSGETASRQISVPMTPAAIQDVNLEFHSAAFPPAGRRPAPGGFAVQIGAFRHPENVSAAIRQARAAGFNAYQLLLGDLTVVRVGPFPSRDEADAA
ncbi:MAG TPA: carboxypeptidase regulatory-like domain-containing protein, partial [Thermoanaerobaculia bacterium]|nr:carboxypeptidase regulatory-like domain-containing protein [Thermoanaerobaculia bacterium]